MDCEKVQELLSEYADNMLDKETSQEVEKHMASCPDCRQEYELLAGILDGCHKLDEEDLPHDFNHELHIRLTNEHMNNAGRRYAVVFKKYGTIAAVFLVLVASIGVFINYGIGSGMKESTGAAPGMRSAEKYAADSATPAQSEAPQVPMSMLTAQENGAETFDCTIESTEESKSLGAGNTDSTVRDGSAAEKVLTTAVINITEDQYIQYYRNIVSLIEQLSGYAENDTSAVYVMPSENLDMLIKTLNDDYNIVNVSIDITDISEEYGSLENTVSELENKQRGIAAGQESDDVSKQLEQRKKELLEMDIKSHSVYIQINRI